MSIFHKMFMAASGAGVVAPTPELADPYFDNVELLLHGDGTSGSTTITDSSPDPKTVTASGNAQIDTAIKKFGSGSVEFDGTNSKLTISGNPIGSGDFTIEFWVYSESISGNQYLMDIKGTNRLSIVRGDGSTSAPNEGLGIYDTGWNGANATLPDAIYQNNWNHIAISRTSGTMKAFVNGTSIDSWTNSLDYSNETIEVGSAHSNQSFTNFNFDGYIDDLRITNGVGRYTTDFNPPDVPHPDIASDQYFYATELLVSGNGTNGSTTFTDESSNALTITANGNVQVDTAVKKFGTGSIEFDGTGDYLTVPDDPAWDLNSSDFTIEAWVYPTASPAQPIIIGQWTSSYSWALMLSNNSNRYLRAILYNGVFNDYVSTSALSLNSWNHCAFVREGNTVSLYLNGTSVYSTSFTGSVGASTSAVSIGANSVGGSPFQGYLDDVRVTKGVARYTSDFTPPRIEHPDFGATREAVSITANADAQISTAQSKFGGSSAYFDGTGDRLESPSLADLSSGSWTIEGWYYFTTDPNSATKLLWSLNDEATNGYAQLITISGTTTLSLQQRGTGTYTSNGTYDFNTNTWYHIAAVWDGTNQKVYVDGSEVISSTTNVIQNAGNGLTLNGDGGGSYNFAGYIDEFRISTIARYTSSFTPPTAAFDNDSNTVLLLHMDNPNSSTTFIDDNGLLTSTE